MLQRGAKAYVGYGIAPKENYNESAIQAERTLKKLADKYENFTLVKFGDTHSKVLLRDNKFVVLSSFNWLSFKGDPNRTFRDEAGFYVAIPERVDEVFQRYISRFAS